MMSSRLTTFRGSSLLTVIAGLSAMTMFLAGCEDDPVQREYPRVKTLEVTNITREGVTFVAEVYDDGNVEITEHGFTWSLNTPSVLGDERVCLGGFSGTGRFEAEINTALAEGINYEVCAFVKAGEYTVYGEKIKFLSLGSRAPEVTGFRPVSAGWGDTVKVTGSQFSHLNSTNRIYIGEWPCNPFYSSDTLLRFILPIEVVKPKNSLSVNILGNVATASDKLTLISPAFYGFSPAEGRWGDTITFTGHHLSLLGSFPADGMMLNGLVRSAVAGRSADTVCFLIPEQLEVISSTVSVIYGPFSYTFPQSLTLLPPVADSFSPAEGTWGTMVTLYGRFNTVSERNRIMFGDKQAQIISVRRDSIVVRVPDDLGEYVTTVRYQSAPYTCDFPGSFTLKKPVISDFSPKEGYVGELVTIRGYYFRKNATTVEIGGSQAVVKSVNDTVITCYVPGYIHGDCDVSVSLMGYSVAAPAKYTHRGAWKQLGDLPFLYDYGYAFDFGEEAYVVTGGETDVYDKEVYRFDPDNNSLSILPDYPGTIYKNPCIIADDSVIYAGCGKVADTEFYRFDPSDDSWETISNVAAPSRTFALSFSIGGKIYIGGHQIYRWYDFWEYDPLFDQ